MRLWFVSCRQAWLKLLVLGFLGAVAGGCYLFLRPSTALLLRNALRFANRGEKDVAIRLFDQVLQRDPSLGTALLYRGQLARDSGDVAGAARFWARVSDTPAPEGATARFLEGTLFLEANRAREAETAFLKSVSLNPDYLNPHERLLKLYVLQLRVQDFRRELEAIHRFREWTLDELMFLVSSTETVVDRQKAMPRVEAFLEADPDDLQTLIALSRYHLLDKRDDDAAKMLERARALSPDDPSVRAALAESMLSRSDLAGAREALAGAPAGPNAELCVWRSHGFYWMAVRDWPKAANCLQQAVLLDPNDRPTIYKLGLALQQTGEGAAASRQFRRVELLLANLTELRHIAERDRDRPESAFSPVLQAATLLMQLDRAAEAVHFFEQALAWDPSSYAAREGYLRARETLQTTARQAPERAAGRKDSESLLASATDASDDLAVATPNPGGPNVPPRIQLVDCHASAGLEFQYFTGKSGQKYILESTGGGVAVLDYDGDGRPDLFFPQGCPIPFNPGDFTYTDRLYRNLGSGGFSDVSAGAGLMDNQYSQGCAAGDYNNDGFADVAIANYGANALYRNNGDGTFADVTSESGISGTHWSTSLAWGDLDRDGDLDLYVVNYALDALIVCTETQVVGVCDPVNFRPEADVLYHNCGDGAFLDATVSAGMQVSAGRGLGIVIADLDDDGWPDVYVANDEDPSFLFQNLGGKAATGLEFVEMGFPSGTAVSAEGSPMAGMGVACGDLDGDGRLDLYVTNFYRETDALYLNRGDLLFEEAAFRAGLAEPTRLMLGWGTQAVDLDLDGRPELFLTNGHVDDFQIKGFPWKMPPQLFYNLGQGRFVEISKASGDFFNGEYLGRGVARLDWNGDGRPDLVIVHQDRPAALLRNDTESAGHRLILELHGVESNRDAIGARIRVTAAGTRQVLEICGGDGFMSTNERRQIVGIGPAATVDELEIDWPGGRKDRWVDIPADSELILIEGSLPGIRHIIGR